MVKFKLGDVISEGFPFAHCVIKEDRETRCHYCLKKRPLHRCSKCQVAYYCSKKCQKIDWKNVHQSECEIFKIDSLKSIPSLFNGNNMRLVLRCLLTIKRHPEKADELVDTFNGPRSFSSLISHFDNFFNLNSTECRNNALGLVLLFRSFKIDFEPEELLEIYGKAMINAFKISDEQFRSAGTGLYIASSALDHSCMPNACNDYDGLAIKIRALKDFDSEKEAPVISYIDDLLPRYERQTLLKEGFFFDCKCVRCLNPENTKLEDDLMKSRLEYEAFLAKTDPVWKSRSDKMIYTMTQRLMNNKLE